jgi:hypothetical protein
MSAPTRITCPRCGDTWGSDDWRYDDDMHSVPRDFGRPELEPFVALRRATASVAVSRELLDDMPSFCLHRLSSHSRPNWQAMARQLQRESTVRARLFRRWHTFRRDLAERLAPDPIYWERD